MIFIFILAFLGGLLSGYCRYISASDAERQQQARQTAEHVKGITSGVIVGGVTTFANVVKNQGNTNK